MNIDIELNAAIANLGYYKVYPLAYKLRHPSDIVDHFIYIYKYKSGRHYLHADFGIRNIEAEEFSVNAIRSLGGNLYKNFRFDRVLDCKLRFPIGKLADWQPRTSILIEPGYEKEIANKVCSDINEYLLPIIAPIITINDFFSVIISNREPWPWVKINGAIRSAQIIYIGNIIGLSRNEINKILFPYHNDIRSNFGRKCDPQTYIDRVFDLI